jgi:hypothetical protein
MPCRPGFLLEKVIVDFDVVIGLDFGKAAHHA